MTSTGCFKVAVNIPEEFAEQLMDAVNGAMEPLHPGYDRVFFRMRVLGTWRPLEGSSPYLGRIGEVRTAEETRIEFAFRGEDMREVMAAVRRVHPYEEPAVDVIPMRSWKEFLH